MSTYVTDTLTFGGSDLSGTCTISTTATLGPDEDAAVTSPNAIGGTTTICNLQGEIVGASSSNVLITAASGAVTGVVYGGADTTTGGGIIAFSEVDWVRRRRLRVWSSN